jgi:hypothetical protein
VLRKLVNESVSTFLSLQRLAEDEAPGGQRRKSQKIKIHRLAYRFTIDF